MTPLNVCDFGAVGDGRTDSTAAFEAALAALNTDFDRFYPAVGGTITIPAGRYVLTRTLHVGIGVRLIGAAARGAYEDSLYHSVGSALLASTPGMTLLSLDDNGTGQVRQQGAELTNLNLYDMSRVNGVEAKTCTLIRQHNTNRCTYRDLAFHDAKVGYWGDPGVADGNAAGDNSWNSWEQLTFWNCATGMGGNYGGVVVGGDSNRCDVGYDTGGYSASVTFTGTKYDGTGVGFRTCGYGVQFLGCKVELHGAGTGYVVDGEPNMRSPAPPTGEGNMLIGCTVTGHSGQETGIHITKRASRTQILGARYSNLKVNVADEGTHTCRLDAYA